MLGGNPQECDNLLVALFLQRKQKASLYVEQTVNYATLHSGHLKATICVSAH